PALGGRGCEPRPGGRVDRIGIGGDDRPGLARLAHGRALLGRGESGAGSGALRARMAGGAAGRATGDMTETRTDLVGRLRRMGGWRRYALILAGDSLAIAAALYLAFLLRFEGRIPPDRWAQLLRCLPILLAIRLTLHVAFGIHRWSFRLSGLQEGVRIVQVS